MFRSKSKTEQLQRQAEATAATLSDQIRGRVGPAVSQAAHAAHHAKDWGQPHVEAAREWAKPHVEHGREWAKPHVEHGIEVAAPKLEHAVSGLAPKVDSARDKIVDELLPRVADAILAVAAASAAAKDEAVAKGQEGVSRGSGAAKVLSGEAVAHPKPRKGRLLLAVGVVAAAGAAVAAFVKKSAPKDDPWATPLSDPYVAPATGRGSTAGSDAEHTADEVDRRETTRSEVTGDLVTSADVTNAASGEVQDAISADVDADTKVADAPAQLEEEPGTEAETDQTTGDRSRQ